MQLKSERFELVKAQAADTLAIKGMFEHISYGGLIDLQFRRGADPYASFMGEGEDAFIGLLKLKESGAVVGMGACVMHDIYYNGARKRGGYLTGLKLLPEYQRKIRYMPQAFRFLHEETQGDVDIYYATIIKNADYIRQMFEKRRSCMPEYTRQCLFTSFCFGTAANTQGLPLEKGNTAGLDEFYNRRLPQYNLAPASRMLHGLLDDDFITWRENGKILAACALFNQQRTKNYYLNGYGGAFKILRHFPSRWLGYPSFPKPGRTVNNVSLSMLFFDEALDTAARTRFIKGASSFASAYDVVLTGLTDTDPSYRAFEKIKHVKYSSYLYTINWGDVQQVTQLPVYLDIALM